MTPSKTPGSVTSEMRENPNIPHRKPLNPLIQLDSAHFSRRACSIYTHSHSSYIRFQTMGDKEAVPFTVAPVRSDDPSEPEKPRDHSLDAVAKAKAELKADSDELVRSSLPSRGRSERWQFR